MKRCFLPALAGVLLCLGFVPAGHAVEILRWERLPLAVPLVVGQERVVFIERNVRIGVPAGAGAYLALHIVLSERTTIVSRRSTSWPDSSSFAMTWVSVG